MTRKLFIIGIALIGISLAFGSNAWADRDKGGKGHKSDKGYHQSYKAPQGHHYGWEKGKKNPHKDRYQHRPEYRHRDHHPQKRVVEKHVYHHYPRHYRPYASRFNAAFSVIDSAFGAVVVVGGRH
jgi:hypothetical protein